MSKHYKISNGTEIPKSGSHFGNLIDLSKMDVGEHFTFPHVDKKRVQDWVNNYGKKNGAAFVINQSETSATCWRTA